MTGEQRAERSVVAVAGPVNAHSHAFHRLLRGRTQLGRGNFWSWRRRMYAAAAALDPERYERVATAVFAEMAVTGWTAVGEFHYLHHRDGGHPYPDHAMERALARAATTVGIRLVLLDACYLSGGIGLPPSPPQDRFSDGDARTWLRRRAALVAALEGESDGLVTVGAAIHSVRAVPPVQLAVIGEELDPSVALHVHLSEQPKENADCLAAYGRTPAALLDAHGLLRPSTAVVHATHLTDDDVALLGERRVSVVMCPTTEADLGDGIGPAARLHEAGAVIALGSDQHAVLDPWLEMRALEHHERLGSGVRGRFMPEQLLAAATNGGRRALGLPEVEDEVLLSARSVRTTGADERQLPLVATAADVIQVTVAGRVIARDGIHTWLGDPAELYTALLEPALPDDPSIETTGTR